MVQLRQFYIIARQSLASWAESENYHLESIGFVGLARTLSEPWDILLGCGVPLRTDSLIVFCARSLLHLAHRNGTCFIMFRLRNMKSAFYASELLDGIGERSTFHSPDDSVNVTKQLLDLSVIHKLETTFYCFSRERQSLYLYIFAMHQNDDGHFKVKTENGYEHRSWDAV